MKSSGIPLDDIRMEKLKDPKRAELAIGVALQEFAKDNNTDCLRDTLELVAKAQSEKQSALKTIPCPDCYGGHFRPCNVCCDSGFVELLD